MDLNLYSLLIWLTKYNWGPERGQFYLLEKPPAENPIPRYMVRLGPGAYRCVRVDLQEQNPIAY